MKKKTNMKQIRRWIADVIICVHLRCLYLIYKLGVPRLLNLFHFEFLKKEIFNSWIMFQGTSCKAVVL